MASKSVAAAVEAALGPSWQSADGQNTLPVIGLNGESEPPPDGSPFIEVDYPVASKKWLTLGDPGNNQFCETGGFRIIINESRTVGISRALAWAESLAALFQGKTFLGGSLQCFEAGVPIINNANDLGNYFQFSFVVTYKFYSFG